MKRTISLLFVASMALACSKGFLDEKPIKSLVVPASLADFWALLDNNTVFYRSPTLGQVASDEFELTDAGFIGLGTAYERNAYIWNFNIFEDASYNYDWTVPYQQIFHSNIVLEGIGQQIGQDQSEASWAQLKGSALFLRVWAYFHLAQVFCPPYRKESATTDLGLPLKKNSDVNILADRSSLEATYGYMIDDLELALGVLPNQSNFTARPTKCAGYSLLARIYLSMSDYEKAGEFAEKALAINNTLLDYNTLNSDAARPFKRPLISGINPEVIFYDDLMYYTYMLSSQLTVNQDVYNLYDINDLRRQAFFNQDRTFKGTYAGASNWFNGLATDELYLIAAECNVRNGQAEKAGDLVNDLLIRRWKKGYYERIDKQNKQSLLLKILEERRKELIGRGLRWSDLRRLNAEPEFEKVLSRTIEGIDYMLLPNSRRYTFPIPPAEIDYSNIEQNPRK